MLSLKQITAAKASLCAVMIFLQATVAWADMTAIRQRGVIRHIGVPYARFVIGNGDGLSTELIKGFAQYIGLGYEYVAATWKTVIPSLTGKTYRFADGQAWVTGQCPVKGDIIATGLTILPWRKALIDYSSPTFPSGIWVISRADSPLVPIRPHGGLLADIEKVKALIHGVSVLSKPGTCLDPALYGFKNSGAHWVELDMNVYEYVPALMNREVECTLLEVADATISLEKWPGKIKVLGPVSPLQEMGCGFRKSDPDLREAFNEYLDILKKSGRYMELVQIYYPGICAYFPDFFSTVQGQ